MLVLSKVVIVLVIVIEKKFFGTDAALDAA